MEISCYEKLNPELKEKWLFFLGSFGLAADDDPDFTVLSVEDGNILACGSRKGSILKYFAVSKSLQGQGITGSIITELKRDAFRNNIDHLFIYTKPQNSLLFESLNFYPVAETNEVLLLEDKKNGIVSFLNSQSAPSNIGNMGAVVVNCNPFTLGHRYLIESAASMCSDLCVFVVKEDRSLFPYTDRIELVRKGIADLNNVSVFSTGDYLISGASFPDYFLKVRGCSTEVQCELDCRIFSEYFAPHFGISKRFAGTEPDSQVTAVYNSTMKSVLPQYGIDFIEIPRTTDSDGRVISASAVRELLGKDQPDELKKLVPQTTFDYLVEKNLI